MLKIINLSFKLTKKLFKNIFCFFLMLLSTFVNAAENSSIENNGSYQSGLNLDGLLQVSSALIIILLIIFTLSVVLKKLNMVPGATTGLIKIISALSLGNKERLLLIEVGEEQILVSVTPGKVNKIHQLSKPVHLEENSGIENNKINKFSELLNSVVKRQEK